MPEGRHLFAYGSLVNRKSLARALGREVAAAELRPARVAGWRRTWGAAERVILDGQDEPIWARFLDLEPGVGRVNGVLVAVTAAELAALERREKGYARLEVAPEDPPVGARAITFAGRREPAPPGGCVLAAYVRLVEEGFAALGDDQLAELRATTDPIDVPIFDGAYRFADAEQNALTTWGAKGA